MVPLYSPGFMKQLGSEMMNRHRCSKRILQRRFQEFFGGGWHILHDAWLLIVGYEELPKGLHPRHLLWAMMQCKIYGTEAILASIANVDEKTYRNWSYDVHKILGEVVHKKVSAIILFEVTLH